MRCSSRTTPGIVKLGKRRVNKKLGSLRKIGKIVVQVTGSRGRAVSSGITPIRGELGPGARTGPARVRRVACRVGPSRAAFFGAIPVACLARSGILEEES